MRPIFHDLTNPVTAAVLPLKTEAQDRAEKDARDLIDRIKAKLAEHDWDVNAAAPRGNSFKDGRNEYRAKMNRHSLFCAVTSYDPSQTSWRMDAPHLRVASPEHEAKFVANAIELASTQYDMFVAKLVRKVGEVTDAKISGSHVWGYSVLTVTKADGTVERWQTQQIVNQSVLGTLFNQWPTRKLKR